MHLPHFRHLAFCPVSHELKKAKAEMAKSKNKQRSPEKVFELPAAPAKSKDKEAPAAKEQSAKSKKAMEEAEKRLAALKLKTHKITSALQWYNNLLDELTLKASTVVDSHRDSFEDEKKDDDATEEESSRLGLTKKPTNALTSDQVIEALQTCDSEELLADVGEYLYLFSFALYLDARTHLNKLLVRPRIKKWASVSP